MDYNVKSWEDVAKEKQQDWYEIFGDRDWDRYNMRSEAQYFMRNVGHAVYGLPDEEPDESNLDTGYSENKLKHIREIYETIKKHDICRNSTDQEVFIGIIYLYMKIDVEDFSHIPAVVFRVLKEGQEKDHSNTFIDSDCRVYVGWADYLNNNKLPKCTYCYPREGVYYGDDLDQVLVDFSTTPAGNRKHKVLDGVDIAGTVVSVGVTLVSAAAFVVPLAGPILFATTLSGAVVGAYGAGRSIDTIIDRKKHGQSIGLSDSNARSTWLSLGANTMGMAASGAAQMAKVMATSGNVLGRTGQIAVNATQVTSIAVNGINIVNTGFVLRDKFNTNSLTPLDIFQFSASILFLTNSVVNLKSAKTIIRESQQNVIKDFEATLRSNRHMKAYARVARNTREGLDPMHGDAKVIKGITNIHNPDDFFSGIVRAQKQFGQNQADVSFTDSGHIAINKELIVDPSKFAAIGKSQRQVILKASKQLSDGNISRPHYETTVNPILNEHGIDVQLVPKVCNAFGVKSLVDLKVGGRRILSNIQPYQLELLLRFAGKQLSPLILPTAIKVAVKLHLPNLVDFLRFLKFFENYIEKLLNEMLETYLTILKVAKTWPDFDQAQFDRDNGIKENRTQDFIDMILKSISVGENLYKLGQAYVKYKETGNFDDISLSYEEQSSSMISE